MVAFSIIEFFSLEECELHTVLGSKMARNPLLGGVAVADLIFLVLSLGEDSASATGDEMGELMLYAADFFACSCSLL